jgi:hypothetical protein
MIAAALSLGCERAEAPPPAQSEAPAAAESTVPVVDNREPAWERPWTLDAEPLFRVGDTTGRPEYELYRSGRAFLLADGRLVIANVGTNEIRYYDAQGRFIRSVGGDGDGPGELRSPFVLIPLEGDSVATGDLRLARLSIFDPEGEFVRSASYRDFPMFAPVAQLSPGRYLFSTMAYAVTGEETGTVRAERFSMDIAVLDEATSMETIASVPWVEMAIAPMGSTPPMMGPRPRSFGQTTFVAGHPGGGFVVADNARPEFELRDATGNLTTVVRWPLEARRITADDAQRELEWRLDRSATPETRRMLSESLGQHPPAPDAMPFFGCAYYACADMGMLTDTEGNTWVLEYVPAAEAAAPHRFLVFDARGVWLGRVEVPAGAGVVWIGSDRLVAKSTTDLGVEIVSVYRIDKGGV